MRFKASALVQVLFGFKGRAKRLDYWLCLVGIAVARIFVLSLGLAWTGMVMGEAKALPLRLGLDALFLWPSVAIVIKRGHDRNRPTLYSAILVGVFYGLGVAIGLLMDAQTNNAGALCMLGLLIGSFYMLIDYGLMEGTKGRNRYGPSPKGHPDGIGTDLAKVFD